MERNARPLLAGAVLVLTVLAPTAGHVALAAGINTDVALSPPEGGTIVRSQWRYSELDGDDTSLDREVTMSVNPVTIVHGVTENFTILATTPIVRREIDFGSATGMQDDNDTGVADIPLLAKYRFYQHDQPGITTRWSVLGGAELPTYDEPFSSDSLDPIIGTVWTHQRLEWELDWDVLYQVNTGGGLDGDDELRADVALSYLLFGGEGPTLGAWGLYAVGEINAKYIADGSTQVFGSPGLQFITPRWILEAGIQLPILQDMDSPRLETDYTAVLSLRFQF